MPALIANLSLVQILQIGAVTVVALLGIPAAIKAYSERSRLEARATTALDLLGKIESGMAGELQIRRNAEVAVRKLAFRIEFPRKIRQRVPIISTSLAIVSGVAALLLVLVDANRAVVWTLIAVEAISVYVDHCSTRNTTAIDRLMYRLFRHNQGARGLQYPTISILRRQRIPALSDVLNKAAFARDWHADQSRDQDFLTSIDAINEGRPLVEARLGELDAERRRLLVKSFWQKLIVIPALRIVGLALYFFVRLVWPLQVWRARRIIDQKIRAGATPEAAAEMERLFMLLKKSRPKFPKAPRSKPRLDPSRYTAEPAPREDRSDD